MGHESREQRAAVVAGARGLRGCYGTWKAERERGGKGPASTDVPG